MRNLTTVRTSLTEEILGVIKTYKCSSKPAICFAIIDFMRGIKPISYEKQGPWMLCKYIVSHWWSISCVRRVMHHLTSFENTSQKAKRAVLVVLLGLCITVPVVFITMHHIMAYYALGYVLAPLFLYASACIVMLIDAIMLYRMPRAYGVDSLFIPDYNMLDAIVKYILHTNKTDYQLNECAIINTILDVHKCMMTIEPLNSAEFIDNSSRDAACLKKPERILQFKSTTYTATPPQGIDSVLYAYPLALVTTDDNEQEQGLQVTSNVMHFTPTKAPQGHALRSPIVLSTTNENVQDNSQWLPDQSHRIHVWSP